MTGLQKKQVSKEYLTEQFDRMAERLARCQRVEYYNQPTRPEAKFPRGTSTVGYEYIDANGARIALVFEYRTPDGGFCGDKRYHPKGLLIDGVWCFL
jgi:hypothetical protein